MTFEKVSIREQAVRSRAVEKLWYSVSFGIRKGLKTAWWFLKLTVPVSLIVTLLSRTGVLDLVGRFIQPAFAIFGLPGESSVVYVTAVLLNNYAGIAAMSLIQLDERQITILAFMMLTCHNLPLESTIQHKAGSSGPRMAVLRLLTSLTGAVVLNAIMPAATKPARAAVAATTNVVEWVPLLLDWAIGIAFLSAKIVGLLVGLMILQQLLQEFGVVRVMARALSPVLWLLGLPRSTAFLWIVANVLGLGYGAAIIMTEVESGSISDEDIDLLNHSIAICHSLLEDTLLFVAVGAWAVWIIAPRLFFAASAVWLFRFWLVTRKA